VCAWGTDQAKQHAAAALWTLSTNDKHRAAIAEENGLAPLIELLSGGTAVAREKAAGALWNISFSAELRVALTEAGALRPLIELLGTGTPEAATRMTPGAAAWSTRHWRRYSSAAASARTGR
jgi:hypothetical protein